MSSAPLTYNRQIDGLRFFAVLGVLICHFIHFENWFLQRLPFGQGVNLFFVISGYLITRILLQNKELIAEKKGTTKKVLVSFYLRRSLRIFPIYYLTIFFLIAINFQNSRQVWPWLVSYTTNFFISDPANLGIGSFMHLWSLAVEEQFYLVWPFLILFVPRKYIEKVIVAVILLSLVFKVHHCLQHGWTVAINALTISCADSLGLGSLLGYWTLYRTALVDKLARIPGIVLLSFLPFFYFLIYPRPTDFMVIVGNNFLYSVFAFFLVLKASVERFRFPGKQLIENRTVVHLGRISYGIYLYHLFTTNLYEQFCKWFPAVFDLWSPAKVWFCFIATILLAELSWYLIESPLMRLKKKVPYTPTQVHLAEMKGNQLSEVG